jgi:hypothetical protein
MVVCASCGTTIPLSDSAPNLDMFWRPIGDERICRDPELCFRRKYSDILEGR